MSLHISCLILVISAQQQHHVPVIPRLQFSSREEWARSLKGLIMKVEAHWWPDFKHEGTKPYACHVIGPLPGDKTYKRFEFDSFGWTYQMSYKEVLGYADRKHENFSTYYLPPPNQLPLPLRKVSIHLKFLSMLVSVSQLTKDALKSGD